MLAMQIPATLGELSQEKKVNSGIVRWKRFSLERHCMAASGEVSGTIEGYQIWLTLRGSTHMTWNMGAEDLSRTIAPHDLCMANHGEFQSVSWAGAFERLLFCISPAVMADLSHETGGVTVELETKRGWHDSKIESMLHLLRTETGVNCHGPAFGEQLGMALSTYLFERYAVARPKKPVDASRRPGPVLRRALGYIDESISSPITVDELARQLNMSRFYFARLFRNTIGQSPGQYILDLRLKQAKLLLKTKKLSLREVALACGFSAQSHFSATFSSRNGYSPTRYRQMHS